MKKLSHFLKSPHGRIITGIVAIIALLFAYYFYAMSKSSSPVDQTEQITISEKDHVRGAAGAKVTLVEFADFQCPACHAYEPLVRQVVNDNKDIVQLVFRNFPLTQIHQNALLAAKAAEAAGVQGKFWEMHDLLYDKQDEWSAKLNARDVFIVYATTLGLDVTKFTADLNNKDIENKILAEYKEGTALGVQGTPTFFVNGKQIENPRSVEAFDKIIKDAAAGK